jgi:hypothetical protein
VWDEDSVVLFYEDLKEILFKEHIDLKYLLLSCKTSGQELTIYFKKTEDKQEWLEIFKKAKKEKHTQDNQIHKAVFILPKNSISEKEPLLPTPEKTTSKCCCF